MRSSAGWEGDGFGGRVEEGCEFVVFSGGQSEQGGVGELDERAGHLGELVGGDGGLLVGSAGVLGRLCLAGVEA